jgi:hypothetical protein
MQEIHARAVGFNFEIPKRGRSGTKVITARIGRDIEPDGERAGGRWPMR